MQLQNLVRRPAAAVAGVVAVAAVAGAGSAVAAKQITTLDIKNGTIQKQDLTKNNFAKFTGTEDVTNAATPVSGNPAFGGQRVVEVPAAGQTPLATLVLDKGTYQLTGVGQFWHIGANPPAGVADYGVVTVPGLQTGFSANYTADVPDGGANPAQVAFHGTIKITANNTPVVITGSFTGAGNAGQAGVQVSATKYEYVKLFKGGQPTS